MRKKIVYAVYSPFEDFLGWCPTLDLAIKREKVFVSRGIFEYCIIKKEWI